MPVIVGRLVFSVEKNPPFVFSSSPDMEVVSETQSLGLLLDLKLVK